MKLRTCCKYSSAGAALFFGMLVLTPRADAGIIIGNEPGNNNLSLGMANTQAYGAGFTMTQTVAFTDAVLTLRPGSTVNAFDVDIYDNSNTNTPGNVLAILTPTTTVVPVNRGNYTFTPNTALTLVQGQTYWLVLRDLGFNAFNWESDSTNNLGGIVPTGAGATYFDTDFANPYPGWQPQRFSAGQNQPIVTPHPDFQIDGPVVSQAGPSAPEPASWLMAMGGLALVIRAKRRR